MACFLPQTFVIADIKWNRLCFSKFTTIFFIRIREFPDKHNSIMRRALEMLAKLNEISRGKTGNLARCIMYTELRLLGTG
jgi:hypothetical protein